MSNLQNHSDSFIKLLEKELYRRQKKNESYSVRAYARDLGVPQSSLARILAQERPISRKFIDKVADKLNLNRVTIFSYLNKKNSKNKLKYAEIELDKFAIVADWYHDAILELIATVNFKGEIKWIAKRLELPVKTIRDAVRRLQQVGLLSIDENKNWLDVQGSNEIFPEVREISPLKMYQKQVLENSIKILNSRKVTERNHTSLTFSASKKNFTEATELITKFRRDLEHLMQSTDDARDEVYQLHVGFFPLTKSKQELQ
jgi:uncharacterized protein (TIGR02147 family)